MASEPPPVARVLKGRPSACAAGKIDASSLRASVDRLRRDGRTVALTALDGEGGIEPLEADLHAFGHPPMGRSMIRAETFIGAAMRMSAAGGELHAPAA